MIIDADCHITAGAEGITTGQLLRWMDRAGPDEAKETAGKCVEEYGFYGVKLNGVRKEWQ